MRKLTVGLIFGGQSPEHEISIMSARSVFKEADNDKYEVIPIGITKKGKWLSPASSLTILNNDDYDEVNENFSNNQIRIEDSLHSFLKQNFDVVFPLP